MTSDRTLVGNSLAQVKGFRGHSAPPEAFPNMPNDNLARLDNFRPTASHRTPPSRSAASCRSAARR